MRRFLSDVLTLAGKDLRIEIRSKEGIFSTLLFVILVLFIFNFGFGTQPDVVRQAAPGILWIVIALSGTIALSHLSHREVNDGVQEGLLLTGLGGSTLFFAKFTAAMVFLSLIEAVAIPLFLVFYNFPAAGWLPPFLVILVLGTVGYAAVGTLLATLLSRSRLKDLLLPVVFYPIIIPWFIVAVKATAAAMDGEPLPHVSFFLGFDIIFVTASALLFDFILEDAS
ncbi:MAG: heme exporter protein CcmB [Pseudomonadota bacterium]